MMQYFLELHKTKWMNQIVSAWFFFTVFVLASVLYGHNMNVIPEEIRQVFFQRYVTSNKKDGTGLGTYSAQLIARAHNGDISFTTSEKEGTNLIITLPKLTKEALPRAEKSHSG